MHALPHGLDLGQSWLAGELGGGHLVILAHGSGDHPRIRTLQSDGRFTQPAGGQCLGLDGRPRSIDQHDVQVSSQLGVLKTIIKYHAIKGHPFALRFLNFKSPIGTSQHRYVRARQPMLPNFIRLVGIGRAVPAHGNRRLVSCFLQPADQQTNKR